MALGRQELEEPEAVFKTMQPSTNIGDSNFLFEEEKGSSSGQTTRGIEGIKAFLETKALMSMGEACREAFHDRVAQLQPQYKAQCTHVEVVEQVLNKKKKKENRNRGKEDDRVELERPPCPRKKRKNQSVGWSVVGYFF